VNRRTLLEEFGLPARTGAPVIGVVSRLVDQKGFDILAEGFRSIAKLNVKLVILGTGQQKYHELFGELTRKYPKKLGLRLEFNNRLAHLVEAGSDFFLMPSRYEPCGLNQMYSLRYGTIPVVRATGGLKDTVSSLSSNGSRGNGILFKQYTSKALIAAIKKAVEFYKDKRALSLVRERIMREDHSWLRSARDYKQLYIRAKGRIGIGLTNR
jgi:starch synthase